MADVGPVRGWSLSPMLLVKSLRVGVNAMFNTSLDPLKLDPVQEGPPDEVGLVNDIHPFKVAGFGYGKRRESGQVGQAAGSDEKVIYELHGGGLPRPGALMLHSSTADWGNTHSGSCSSTPTATLCTTSLHDTPLALNLLAPHPWTSPASLRLDHPKGLFVGLSPSLILAGAAEMSLDSMKKTLADRMRADMGTDLVTYVETANATQCTARKVA
ncbi:hypothetical protein PC9H_005558 [Pleurotus ostreatus]|uniref:Uncharacterized protein n=1 Tax=Pleurotus ostreatus TaxID=5322 RepID=A0A8H7DUH5_PLEOS|nr:uncharacterized protein PC9H_005558 [Pleurotus ostreatus]KAF7433597.1 hypothetical protein PC9H_005558 [Pleurotus ostreatus]